MFRIHPGTSDHVVELMIATQLKGLGGRRNKECRLRDREKIVFPFPETPPSVLHQSSPNLEEYIMAIQWVT